MSDPAVNEADADPSPSPSPAPNTSLVATGIGDLAARATFLAIFIILGVVGNCVLVATIAQSTRLKGTVLNLLIISVSVVNLVDCLGNMPLILGSAIREHWDYGTIVCNFNAFLMQMVTLGMILGLLLMTLDRFLATKFPDNFTHQLTKVKANVLIVYTWIHAVAFSFPLILGKPILVAAFPARYSCSIKAGAPLLYVALTSILGILIPFLLIVIFFVCIIKTAVHEKVRRKRNLAEKAEQGLTSESRLWAELNASKYVGVLVILWAIFQGPYLLLTYIEQYRTTSEIESAALLNFSYPWEMELAFTWMKLSYPMFLPLITLLWKKEVWQRFKNFILCRKSNLIVDASPNSSPSHKVNGGEGQAAIRKNDTNTSLAVPVIFATEEGLHYQTFGKRSETMDEELDGPYPEYDYSTVNGSQILTARKCDIYGSQDFMQIRDDEDTSDYDSHGDMDPYSNSNAMSVKSAEYDKAKVEAGRRSRENSESKNSRCSQEHDIQQNIEEFEYQTGVELTSTEACAKKQRKSKMKTNQEDLPDPDQRDNRKSTKQDPERGSHDSGRGSMEDRSQKKKRLRAQKLEQYSGPADEDPPHNEPATVPASDVPEPDNIQVIHPRAVGDLGQCEVDSPSNKPRKKKKKKAPVKPQAEDTNIELKRMEEAQDTVQGAQQRPIPPPRLKPLERPGSLTLESAPDLPEPRARSRKEQKNIIRQVSEFTPDMHTDETSFEPVNKKLSGSEPSVVHPVVQTQVQTAQSTHDVRPRTSSSSSGGKPLRKDRHQRKGTSDSQTALLNSSNNSVDFNAEMHILAAKAVSETVHITPKTPDNDMEGVEYVPRVTRKNKRGDEERI